MGRSEGSADSKDGDVECPRKMIKLDEGQKVQSVMDHHVLAENDPKAEEEAEKKVDTSELNGENPEEILLRIQDIREEIFGLLSNEDLMRFRSTNSLWNNNVSTYMLKKKTPLVTFEFNSTLKEYRSPTKFGPRSLTDTLDRFSKSKIFPYNNFTFIGGDFADVQADWVISFRQFFSQLGPQIKNLVIGKDGPNSPPLDMDMDTLRSILLNDAKNIETLELSYFPNIVWDESNRLSLPALKTLYCPSKARESTVYDMLGDAPNLESVHRFKLDYLNTFLSKFKIDLIKDLHPICHCHFSMEYLNTLAMAQPKLTTFFIQPVNILPQEQLRGDFMKAVNLILESSKESLLHLGTLSMSIDGIVFPQLATLKTVLFIPFLETSQFFPTTMRLSDIFPIVEKLQWSFLADVLDCNSLIPGTDLGILTTVHSLIINTRQVVDCLAELDHLTPNVTALTINGTKDPIEGQVFESILTRYPNITKLYTEDCEGHLLPSLSDSSLTGIPEEICEQLRQSNGQLVKELRDVKTRPGISDFKCLKEFKIVLGNDKWTSVNMSHPLLPSWVSGVYGFSCLPHLKVSITFNQYCPSSQNVRLLLAPLVPYVTLVHETTE